MDKIKKIVIFLPFCLFFLSSYVNTAPAIAGTNLWQNQEGLGNTQGGNIGRAFGEADARPEDIRKIIVNILKVFLGFLGFIFVILVIWGGFKWMTAAGNQDDVEKAKGILKTGIIGFVIVMCAYIIVHFVYIYIRREIWGRLF
jgi:hypothetical protein